MISDIQSAKQIGGEEPRSIGAPIRAIVVYQTAAHK